MYSLATSSGKSFQYPPGGTKSKTFFLLSGYLAPIESGTFFKTSLNTGLYSCGVGYSNFTFSFKSFLIPIITTLCLFSATP